MTDSLGQEFTFVNNGYWGPEEGFDITEGYSATTECKITVDEAGDYEVVISIVKADDLTELYHMINSFIAK